MQIILAISAKNRDLYLRNFGYNLNFMDQLHDKHIWIPVGPDGVLDDKNVHVLNYYEPNRPYKEARNALRWNLRGAQRKLRFNKVYGGSAKVSAEQLKVDNLSDRGWQQKYWERLAKEIEIQILEVNLRLLKVKEVSCKPLGDYYPKTIKAVA